MSLLDELALAELTLERAKKIVATVHPAGADIGKAKDEDYLKAAAILAIDDTVQFRSLRRLLKSRGVKDWEPKVFEWEFKIRQARAEHPKVSGQSSPAKSKKPSAADALIAIGQKADLFHDGEDAYATAEANGHHETFHLKSLSFNNWLRKSYLEQHNTVPSGEVFRTAVDTLKALAQFRGQERKVFIRIAGHEDKIYLDLCNEQWQVVEIGPDNWSIIESKDCPVRFRRARGMLPLPTPQPDGQIGELRKFINAQTDKDFLLIVSWLVGCFRERGPYPILVLHGSEGTAKTTTARTLRDLIDPNIAPLRGVPKEEGDLMIAARSSWIIAYDNLSHLQPWLSDALCRVSTGGGLGKRELFTDIDEILINVTRPVLITAIDELATRGDFLNRSIVQYLSFIDDHARKSEESFDKEFNAARPKLLGALLTVISSALKHRSSTHINELPRMADFALWVTAGERALGWESGAFLEAYAGNRQAATDITLDASPIGPLIRDGNIVPFSGTATKLLEKLEGIAEEKTKRLKAWPSSGQVLSNALRRLSSTLRAAGIRLDFGRDNTKKRNRTVILEKVQNAPDASPDLEASELSEVSDYGQTSVATCTSSIHTSDISLDGHRPPYPQVSDPDTYPSPADSVPNGKRPTNNAAITGLYTPSDTSDAFAPAASDISRKTLHNGSNRCPHLASYSCPDRQECEAIHCRYLRYRDQPETEQERAEIDRLAQADADNGAHDDHGDGDPIQANADRGEPLVNGGIAFVLTHQMRADLRDLGYTDEEIAKMTPAKAHEILKNDDAVFR